MSVLRVVLTAVFSVIALFLLTKLIGNKQLSELNMFDYINGISIGSIAAEMSTSEISEMWDPLIAMVVYTLFAVALAMITRKSTVLRRFINGKTSVLYDKGKIFSENLKRSKLDLNEFLVQLRVAGYFSLSDIEAAYFESNGKVSVLPKTDKNFCTPQQLNITVENTRPDVNVIIDGTVLYKNLRYIGKDINWLDAELKRRKKSVNDIFLAVCDTNSKLTIYDKNKSKPTNDIFQ